VRCDSRNGIEVIAFTAEDLKQEVTLPSVDDVLDTLSNGNGHSSDGHTHSSNGHSSNGHSTANGHSSNGISTAASVNSSKNGDANNGKNGNGNGHSSNKSEASSAEAKYKVVSSSSSSSSRSHTAAANRNGNGNASAKGHVNGTNGNSNGRSKDTAQNPTAATAAAAAAAQPAMVDTEALGAQAAAAWESCAPSLVLPGQQLSSVTFDCGVSVTINRSDVAAVAGSSSSDEDEGAEATAAAAAAAGEYYVRVTLPADFGRDCILHWAVENWELPSPACRPPNSKQVGSVWPVCRRAGGGGG
jgi:hypothetical protein